MPVRSSVGGAHAKKWWELTERDPSAINSVAISTALNLHDRTGLGITWRRDLHKTAMYLAGGGKIKIKHGNLYYPWDGAAETIATIRKNLGDEHFDARFVGFVGRTIKYLGGMVRRRPAEIRLIVGAKKALIDVAFGSYSSSEMPLHSARQHAKKRNRRELSKFRKGN